jgi:hypothetical protein
MEIEGFTPELFDMACEAIQFLEFFCFKASQLLSIFPLPHLMNSVSSSAGQEAGQRHTKRRFTFEEDAALKGFVAQYGENNWQLISERMWPRNQRQCKERWLNYLSPRIRNLPWTPQEDEFLLNRVEEWGQKWVKIARCFGSRTDINVKNRFLVLSRRTKRVNTKEVIVESEERPVLRQPVVLSYMLPGVSIRRCLLPPKKIMTGSENE